MGTTTRMLAKSQASTITHKGGHWEIMKQQNIDSEYVAIGEESSDNGELQAINEISSDKSKTSAINADIGDKIGDKSEKSAINYKDKILEYLKENLEARSQDIALFIGLKQSRTKDYLSELVEEGKIVANGANKNRTYSRI